MKTVGLFAGIGGFERGLAQSNHETVLLSEISDAARHVLAARFPDIDLVGDVVAIPDLPSDIELLCAGFPCQDLSQAGLTAGIAGTRSGLVGHVFRLLDRRPIPWVVLENVSFMLHLDRGSALAILVNAFEERGYRWAYRVVNSLSFLPQRRERVFLVATQTQCDPANVLLADEAIPPNVVTSLESHAHGFYWTEGTRGLGWAPDAVPTLKNGSTVGIPSPPAILLPDGRIVTPDIRDAERLQGFPANWTRPAEETTRPSFRWSLVGNAVTVPVAAWLGRRLGTPGNYDTAKDRELPASGSWPRAARFDGERRMKVQISDFVTWKPREPLHVFLRFEGTALSARATRGFLSRADASRLRFVNGFKDRVRNHLSRMECAPTKGGASKTAA